MTFVSILLLLLLYSSKRSATRSDWAASSCLSLSSDFPGFTYRLTIVIFCLSSCFKTASVCGLRLRLPPIVVSSRALARWANQVRPTASAMTRMIDSATLDPYLIHRSDCDSGSIFGLGEEVLISTASIQEL